MKIAQNYNVNYNMLYTAAAYHDIGDHIDREHHEIVSAQIMYEDKKLKEFFKEDEIQIIKEAIEDHRASLGGEPRSIYGKILTSADKNTDVNSFIERTMSYSFEHFPENTKEQDLDRAYKHAVKKYGKEGYATNAHYVKNNDYDKFINDLQELIENKEEFYKKAEMVYERLKNK